MYDMTTNIILHTQRVHNTYRRCVLGFVLSNSFSENCFAEHADCLLVDSVHQMAINVHRDVDAAVAEVALDVFRMFSLGDKQTGVSVPKIVELHAR